MNQNNLYISALLYDVERFIKYVDSNYKKNYLSSFKTRVKSIFKDLDKASNNSLVSSLIEFADQLSAIEAEDSLAEDANSPVLQSVFSNLFFNNKSVKQNNYRIQPLDLENIFPVEKVSSEEIFNLINSFLNELISVNCEEQLLYILEKYFWGVSIGPWHNVSDVSLFDHSKTTAAIALCLYQQYVSGELTEEDIRHGTPNSKEQFILVNGDISGIQDFIFNVPSKGAAKSLKGRSVYIGMLTDIVARFIIDRLKLKEANILYNGGGNFFILAPACKKGVLKEVKKEVLTNILEAHDGDIYLAIGTVPVAPCHFYNFTERWEEVKKRTNRFKQRKWSDLGLKDNFKKIFGPLDNGKKETECCKICGTTDDKRRITVEDESHICELCKSFIGLTNKLKKAKYLQMEVKPPKETKIKNYNDIFRRFGYEIEFLDESKKNKGYLFKLNSTDFISEKCTGFKFGAFHLPYTKETQITFEELAEKAIEEGRGDKKLGILKLDVDNLGAIFNYGFKGNKTISRVTNLSRMLSLYFEGYINKLIDEKGWQDKLYVVFSGGDDTFIVGAWNAVFNFAENFYSDFRIYTCYNKYVTFSAGIGVYKYNFPIVRSASLTEEALNEAKKANKQSKGGLPLKNKVSIFGEVFNWEEFKRIKQIKELLEKLVVKRNYGHALLYKVNKSTIGFKKILADSTRGKVDNIRFWRLAYYLREVKEDDIKNNTDDAEKLIDEYRDIVVHNLFKESDEEKIKKIMIIPAAVKWAELATRDYKGSED